MKRKEQIIISEQQGAKCPVRSLRFIFLFLFFSQFAFAQSSQKYDLNDPRNPDCPCHKVQKQAEEEFARQNKQTVLEQVEVNNQANNAEQEKVNLPTVASPKSVSNSVTASGNISRHRKKITWFTKLKFRCSQKVKRTKKIRPDYSVCYNKW